MAYNPLYRGNSSKAPSRALQTSYINASGFTLVKGAVAASNTSGQAVLIDVSDEASAQGLLGVIPIDVPNAGTGAVVSGGRLEDISQAFALGDPVYVGKTGIIVNFKPEYGVSGFTTGDFVIFVGVVVKNEFDITKKDVQLMIQTIGQL